VRYLGIVTDTRLLSFFANFARPVSPFLSAYSASEPSGSSSASLAPPSPVSPRSPLSPSIPSTASFQRYLGNTLQTLPLPSLNLYTDVITLRAQETVLDAMRRMSEHGVSSVAVLDDTTGSLLSAISVTDIGRMVVPAQNNQILSTPLQQLIAQIKVHFFPITYCYTHIFLLATRWIG
jgi:hypothetical protein